MKNLKALDRLVVRSTTTITKTTPQTSVENMIDLIPIDLLIQKVGISAYIRLQKLNTPCTANEHKAYTTHAILGKTNCAV